MIEAVPFDIYGILEIEQAKRGSLPAECEAVWFHRRSRYLHYSAGIPQYRWGNQKDQSTPEVKAPEISPPNHHERKQHRQNPKSIAFIALAQKVWVFFLPFSAVMRRISFPTRYCTRQDKCFYKKNALQHAFSG